MYGYVNPNKKIVFSDILKGVQPSWSVTEKARYVYYKLAQSVIYDTYFMYGKNKSKLREIYNKEIDIDKPEIPVVVCNTINDIYLQLLQRLGIEARKITKSSNVGRIVDVESVALIFKDENGEDIYTNIIGDLQNCRFNCFTEFFWITKSEYKEVKQCKSLDINRIKDIDKKVGIIEKDYEGTLFFQMLQNEFNNMSGEQKDDFLLVAKMEMQKMLPYNDRFSGPYERKKWYTKLLKSAMFTKKEWKNIEFFEYAKRIGKKFDIKNFVRIKLPNEEFVFYIWNENTGVYELISYDDVLEIVSKLEENNYTEKRNKSVIPTNNVEEEIEIPQEGR